MSDTYDAILTVDHMRAHAAKIPMNLTKNNQL